MNGACLFEGFHSVLKPWKLEFQIPFFSICNIYNTCLKKKKAKTNITPNAGVYKDTLG